MNLTPLEDLQDLIDIQLSDGNWNANGYMHGMANGMILSQSVLDLSNTPDFKEAPEGGYLDDLPEGQKQKHVLAVEESENWDDKLTKDDKKQLEKTITNQQDSTY